MNTGPSRTFQLLLNEGHLMRSCLIAGLKTIPHGSLIDQGRFYEGFFNFTIGLERALKMCWVIEHCVEHEGTFPSDDELRHRFGHNLNKLWQEAVRLCRKYGRPIKDHDEIQVDLLTFLYEFAAGARYYNLRELSSPVGADSERDPTVQWRALVKRIYCEDVSPIKRDNVEEQAEARVETSENVFVIPSAVGSDGEPLSKADTFMEEAQMAAAMPHVLWRMNRLLLPSRDLAYRQFESVEKARSANRDFPEIPHTYEHFGFLALRLEDIDLRNGWPLR